MAALKGNPKAVRALFKLGQKDRNVQSRQACELHRHRARWQRRGEK